MGSEFYEIESGLLENAASVIDDQTTCVMRFWKYYDADGEYYISKAIFWMCRNQCDICQEKVKKALEEQEQEQSSCCNHCHSCSGNGNGCECANCCH